MIENKEGYVKSEISEGVATVEFQHPMSNSLPGAILKKLAETISALGKNDEAKVIVLKSAGEKAFCAGASFDELISITNKEDGSRFFSGFAFVINEMRKCPKFIIARVQGKAVGGGVGLIAAADYAVGVNTAAVKLSELAVGIGPFVVGPAVERKIGMAAFSELAIDATAWRSATWAHSKGLYASIHDDIQAVDATIGELAGTLKTSSPQAMKDLKNVIWEGTSDWDDLLLKRAAISGRLVLSPFAVNAINKFKSKG